MTSLITGGAGSGKSALAEALTLRSNAANRVYLATMRVWGPEEEQRVARHRALRRGKGFVTIEQTTGLSALSLPENCALLLEDLGNLTANECFGGGGFDGAAERILSDLDALTGRCRDLIVVTNELFSDGHVYAPETMRYLRVLAQVNRALARRFDRVVETVVGLPIVWKGALE